MKKIICAVLAAAVCLSLLAGCSGQAEKPESGGENSQSGE